MKKHIFLSFGILVVTLLTSCQKKELIPELKTGDWRGEITIQSQQLPFNFEVRKVENKFIIDLHDGENIIELDEVSVKKDSVFFTMHIFDIDVKAKIEENSLQGTYTKNYATDYVLPFKATFGKSNRIDNGKADQSFNGKWDLKMHKNNGESFNIIGDFKTEDSVFKGNIRSKTSDYRFLEGSSDNRKFTLYGFDGNHMYILKAKLENDSIQGDFWSGKTLHQTFSGVRDESIELPNPKDLTYLKEGYDKIEFSFPDLNGNMVSLSDPKYQNKVVILQLLGSWCPNCMDETKFYKKWLDENKDKDVKIIGLAYEVKDDFEYAKKRIQKMKEKLKVDYDFVIAGTSKSGEASKSLPMLNHVMSFPTSIIIGKDGKVNSIHTGFSGPATGDLYLHFVEEFNKTMNTLLSE